MLRPFLALLVALSANGIGAASDFQQLIVAVAPDWNSSTGKAQLFHRTAEGWKADSEAFPVLFGAKGLAWGRGEKGEGESGLAKKERDGRAPAGLFRIGKIYGYDPKLPSGAEFPYHQVTAADAWIDDPQLPDYNRHVAIDPKNPPDWFQRERMRTGDFAYRWLVEIRHNSDPPKPGAGSAIFFHIRRGVTRPTAGCTTMAEENLVRLIRWLRAENNPHYVLLPASEYQKKWKRWQLPSPESVSAF